MKIKTRRQGEGSGCQQLDKHLTFSLFSTMYCSSSAAHTQTHMQTVPRGVFSPEVAICTCLFGMQWALPPIPAKPIPSQLFVALTASTYVYLCPHIFVDVSFSAFVCACMCSCLILVVCLPVLASLCGYAFCLFVCLCVL